MEALNEVTMKTEGDTVLTFTSSLLSTNASEMRPKLDLLPATAW
jgi:hypothetical protein